MQMVKLIEQFNTGDIIAATPQQIQDLMEVVLNDIMMPDYKGKTYSATLFNTFIFAMKEDIDGKTIITFWVCKKFERYKYEI